MAEPATLPLWVDLAAVGFGAAQGGVFAATGRDERNDFDILGVAVFALVMGLGGGVIRDVMLGQVPAALRDDTYLLVAVAAGFAGMFVADHVGRLRWTFDALDALVVGLFVIGSTVLRPATAPAAPCDFQCTPTPELIQLSLVVPKSIGCAPAVPAAIASAPVAASAARTTIRRFTCPLL